MSGLQDIRKKIIIIFYRKLRAVYITLDGCHYVWHKAQTATLHYTREPADWPTLKPDAGLLTHLPLRDSGTRLQDTLCPGHRCFDDITSHQLGLSRPTPVMNATPKRATNTNDTDYPRRQVHITSIPVCQPPRSKPYCTNRREEEGLTLIIIDN